MSVRFIDHPAPPPPSPEAFLRQLGGAAVLRVAGRDRRRVRAVSTLLHGNEPSGLRAVHAWLCEARQPAVDALILLGGVETALVPPGFAHRSLPDRRDLNRCFREPFSGRDGAIARQLLDALWDAAPEALVDLHNTTGHTPPYGVGPSATPVCLALVSLFGDRFVHSDLALGALVEATDPKLPSVTVECGFAGSPEADAVATRGLRRYLEEDSLESRAPHPVRVLRHPVRVRIRSGARIAYADGPDGSADLTVARDVDRHNFETLDPETPIGWLGRPGDWPVEARGSDGREVSRELFTETEGVLRARLPLVPIMMTTDPVIAASDCLFYVVREDPGTTRDA